MWWVLTGFLLLAPLGVAEPALTGCSSTSESSPPSDSLPDRGEVAARNGGEPEAGVGGGVELAELSAIRISSSASTDISFCHTGTFSYISYSFNKEL